MGFSGLGVRLDAKGLGCRDTTGTLEKQLANNVGTAIAFFVRC